ncbi:PTS sugar transporter subunit IIB [Salmonella enterica]|uniref:PTS sugar transporter subunit IIB n=1 Tax=Salmonella enterica TaxID=28901 RepID=UPI000A19652E|nr:PTS sugar transporter subunit IIB [Salmonella enterica]EAW1160669.1 PTS sugar transporter subunit IIB [Salmonella enterica subsp. enterica]EAW1318115.1 PTS sugar transporter subunit IIB [Salmonella enterica subsp. diarizonae]ECS6416414.1 PTS sugar transporter subunit IIB [Salmonella enterica subsp. diarizonae serovar 50:r:z]EAN1157273.1 PTS sugar transporter subunit IIB [Salmonella enterica]EAO0948249.1 PTS sugar transporter subunit IIB [Salmonella enterica]
MKNILLVCAAGMSTSMLVKRMCEYAATINAEVNINALAIAEAKNNEADIVLLGPQVRFQKSEIEGIAQGRIPVAVIDMKDYGAMNGKSVLEFAFKLLEQQYNQ